MSDQAVKSELLKYGFRSNGTEGSKAGGLPYDPYTRISDVDINRSSHITCKKCQKQPSRFPILDPKKCYACFYNDNHCQECGVDHMTLKHKHYEVDNLCQHPNKTLPFNYPSNCIYCFRTKRQFIHGYGNTVHTCGGCGVVNTKKEFEYATGFHMCLTCAKPTVFALLKLHLIDQIVNVVWIFV